MPPKTNNSLIVKGFVMVALLFALAKIDIIIKNTDIIGIEIALFYKDFLF